MEAGGARRQIMVALEPSEESTYALEWALEYLVISPDSDHLILLYVAPESLHNTMITGKEVSFSSHVLSVLEKNKKQTAHRVIELAKTMCEKYNVTYETKVMVGEAKFVICDAAKKLNVDLLVVGGHDFGAIKR
ncbi:hypothetical protein AMTR_s00105p00074810 [Amborella trichopoda]|uniref:UspA domain-containing protein n=2 Tax=Amborella trichopoda TaxID=13333 RepID=W1NXH9_AMBTC|nr:hypothetical protein AMTR_s00105p00074810 [Amborella trichopoda]